MSIIASLMVRALLENAWFHLFQIDADGRIHQRRVNRR